LLSQATALNRQSKTKQVLFTSLMQAAANLLLQVSKDKRPIGGWISFSNHVINLSLFFSGPLLRA
jgi:hypothetical protein